MELPKPKIFNKANNLNIVYEDKDIIVVNKPAGLTVHCGIRTKRTLVDLIIEYYPSIKNVGEDAARPGIVHRLDKDTSGLMVIAKNNKTFYLLKGQFMERKVGKRYIVLVEGRIKTKRGIITGNIGRWKNKQIVLNFNPNQKLKINKLKSAITKYRVVKYFDNYTLCEVEPKTGRMHQIRAHFKSIGHPVAGDKKYAFRRQVGNVQFSRQFLHASYLSFSFPNGKGTTLEADLPADLVKILVELENSGNN